MEMSGNGVSIVGTTITTMHRQIVRLGIFLMIAVLHSGSYVVVHGIASRRIVVLRDATTLAQQLSTAF